MLEYKFDVIKELQEAGINLTTAKKTGVFSQSTMRKFKTGDTSITLNVLNKLCCILEMQPRDILKYVETGEEKEILENIRKTLESHENS